MKPLVIKALAAVGLVPIRRYEALARRADQISRDLVLSKKLAVKNARQVRQLEKQRRDFERHLRKLSASSELTNELVAMQTRLAETERVLAAAREYLQVIEVKLDILEGAANVLDARTRTARQRQTVS